jgi:hypothetical protein
MALLVEAAPQEAGHLRFVLDHEHTHARIVAPGHERKVNGLHRALIGPGFTGVVAQAQDLRITRSVAAVRRVTGGAEGNARLTAITAAVLIVLLAVEGATIPWLGSLLTVHVFVGMLLLGPVALKLASTGYRLLGYYTGRREYVAKGPPAPFMRLLVAPVLVASTITLFASGIAVVAIGHGGMLLGLHKASFLVWLGAAGLHVLAYARRAARQFFADRAGKRPGGRGLRLALVAGVLAAGVAIAVATLPLAHAWMHGAAGFPEH